MAAAAWPASPAAAVVDDQPVILGPSSSVHHVVTSGYEGTLDWVSTQGIINPEVNAALWEASLSEGIYQVEAWIPLEVGYTYARYNITHRGHISEVRLHQADFGNSWVTLGTYAFDGSQSSIRSTDAAGYPGEQLVWDAMRWTPVNSIPANIETQGAITTINEPQISGPEEFVVRFVGIGYRDDLFRVFAQGTNATPVNTATWVAPLAAGDYTVEAFIPKQHAEAEVGYTIKASTGNATVRVAQKSYNNLWVKLGDFSFGSAGATVTTTDATGVKEEEITWDALRFVRIPTPPPAHEAGQQQPPVGGQSEVPPPPRPRIETKGRTSSSCPSTKKGKAARTVTCASKAEIARLQHAKLIEYEVHPIFNGGTRDAYEILSFASILKKYKLRYRCAPCLFMAKKVPAGTRTPVTHRSRAKGDAKRLIGKVLYKGSVLQLAVKKGNRPAILYTYRLPGGFKIDRSAGCIAAVAGQPEACAH